MAPMLIGRDRRPYGSKDLLRIEWSGLGRSPQLLEGLHGTGLRHWNLDPAPLPTPTKQRPNPASTIQSCERTALLSAT